MIDKSRPYGEERTVSGASYYTQDGKKFDLNGIEIETPIIEPKRGPGRPRKDQSEIQTPRI